MFCSLFILHKVYQHAIDNLKLIAEIRVLASEMFKTKLCWKRSKKMLRVKKHPSASKPLHNCSNRCHVSFCNNDHAYMYLYFCMRRWLQLFCSQLQILERRNFVSWKRNFVSSKRYFVSPKRNFASSKRNFALMTRNFVQRARNLATLGLCVPCCPLAFLIVSPPLTCFCSYKIRLFCFQSLALVLSLLSTWV